MSGDAQQSVSAQGTGSTSNKSLIAEFRLDMPLLRRTFQRAPDVAVDVEQELAVDDTQPLLTIRAIGDDAIEFAEFERALSADETVADVERLNVESTGERRYRLSVPRIHSLYWTWATQGAVLLDATHRSGEWAFRLRVPDREAFAELREHCREREWGFTLTQLKQTPSADGNGGTRTRSTTKQRELLNVALERGYFDIPRGVSLRELAAEFDISDQAASERLRRALSNHLDITH